MSFLLSDEKRRALLNVRKEYMVKNAKIISWVKSTAEWQKLVTTLGYEDYDFIAPHMGYLKQMIRLNISSFNTSPLHLVTDFRLLAVTALHSRIGHLCEYGIGVLIVEKKSRRAVAYMMHMDLCDYFYVKAARYASHPERTAEIEYLNEIFSALYKTVDSVMPSFNDGMWETEQQLRELWGVYTVSTFAFVSPHMKGGGLIAILAAFITVAYFEVGYKKLFFSLGHWRTVKMIQAQGVGIIGSVDIPNFVFSDGNSIRKLLEKHRKKYLFDVEFIHQLESSLVLKMCCYKKYSSWQVYILSGIQMFLLYEAKKAQMLSKMKQKSKL